MKKSIFGLLSLISIFYALIILVPPKVNAYVYAGHRWSGTTRNYYVNTSTFTCCDANQVLNDLALASGAWTSQTHANFQYIYAGTTMSTGMKNDGISTVFAEAGTSPYGYVAETNTWYDGTGHLADADFRIFQGAVGWVTSDLACSSQEWIYQIMTHEFGHGLELLHSDVATATMHAGIGYCDNTEYTLDPDDILAIETIYGTYVQPAPSPSPSPNPSPTPPPNPQPTGATLTVRAYKLRGLQKVDLSWAGLTTTTVDMYRNNSKILSGTSNDGLQTDAINKKGGGSYTYRVCELGSTDICTNNATAQF